MQMADYVILGALLLLVLILFALLRTNGSLKKENGKLRELLRTKEKMIEKLEDSKIIIKETTDNPSLHNEIVSLLGTGESKEAISEKLNIPLSKLELIVKFDAIKKEKRFGV